MTFLMPKTAVLCAREDKEVAMAEQDKTQTFMRRYTFKLYPNTTQRDLLQRQAALSATLWNAALEQRETQWRHEELRKARRDRKGLSKFDQSRYLKHLNAADPDFKMLGSSSKQLVIFALDDAFSSFFRRAKSGAGSSSGYPKYKPVHDIEHRMADCTIWHRDHLKGWRMARSGKQFRIYAFGLGNVRDKSTWLKARGRFPVDIDRLDLRDMQIIRRGGVWQCSIAVRMAARRVSGDKKIEVNMDLIDEFATVTVANGECLSGWEAVAKAADEQISPKNQGTNPGTDAEGPKLGDNDRNRQSNISDLQSYGDRKFKRGSYRWRQSRRRVAKRLAKEARQRKERLHLATTSLARQASELMVIAPDIRENTKSAKGDRNNWGAAVGTVAALNRHVLSQAPATAIQMLEYKCAEAGITFSRIIPDSHALSIGRELPAATKAARKARNIMKKEKQVETV